MLTISNVQLQNAGTYTCNGENDNHSVFEEDGVLSVISEKIQYVYNHLFFVSMSTLIFLLIKCSQQNMDVNCLHNLFIPQWLYISSIHLLVL